MLRMNAMDMRCSATDLPVLVAVRVTVVMMMVTVAEDGPAVARPAPLLLAHHKDEPTYQQQNQKAYRETRRDGHLLNPRAQGDRATT